MRENANARTQTQTQNSMCPFAEIRDNEFEAPSIIGSRDIQCGCSECRLCSDVSGMILQAQKDQYNTRTTLSIPRHSSFQWLPRHGTYAAQNPNNLPRVLDP